MTKFYIDQNDNIKMQEYNRRNGDTMFSKLSKVAAIIIALSVILGATIKVLSTEFVKKGDAKICQDGNDQKFNKIEIDQTRVIQKLDDMSSDVKEIKRALIHR